MQRLATLNINDSENDWKSASFADNKDMFSKKKIEQRLDKAFATKCNELNPL